MPCAGGPKSPGSCHCAEAYSAGEAISPSQRVDRFATNARSDDARAGLFPPARTTIMALGIFLLFILIVGCESMPQAALQPSPATEAKRPPSPPPGTPTSLPSPAAFAPRAFPSGVAFTPPAPAPTVPLTPKSPADIAQERAEAIARFESSLAAHGIATMHATPWRYESLAHDPSPELHVDAILGPQAQGEIPIVLASFHGDFLHQGLVIFTLIGGNWSHQEYALPDQAEDPEFVAGLQESHGGHVDLGVAWNCANCSAPHTEFRLLRSVDNRWLTVWQPQIGKFHGAHAEDSLKFVAGLDRFTIHYSDWSSPDNLGLIDGRAIFGAANGGPHRWFIDTWQRTGDSYHLVDTLSIPSTYKTTVEFFSALLRGNNAAAAHWTTGQSLVSRARALALDQLPMPLWASDDDKTGMVSIWSDETPNQANPRMNPHYLLKMVKPGTEWLVDSIELIK
jgi:hypothetical protein